jgi:hypothetical protein
MMAYGLNGAGQVDIDTTSPSRRFDTVETTVEADPLVAPNGVAFATNIIRNGSAGNPERTERYRYFANGDIARYNPSFTLPSYARTSNDTVPFVSRSVSVPEHFVVLPYGSKRDYSVMRYDTTVTVPVGANWTQTTHYTIADTVVFQGPVAVHAPDLLGTVFPLLPRPAMQAMWSTVKRTLRVVSLIDAQSRSTETVIFSQYWYSPQLGYMVQEESYIQGKPEFAGTGYTLLQ